MKPESSYIIIRTLQPQEVEEFSALVSLFADVFEMEDFTLPPAKHLAHVLTLPHFLAITASVEGKIIGGLTAYVLDRYYGEAPQAYIYDLAVHQSFQRQGIGRRLVAALNTHCADAGFDEVFVQADAEDAHTLDFYRTTAASREAAVVHFTYKFSGDDQSVRNDSHTMD